MTSLLGSLKAHVPPHVVNRLREARNYLRNRRNELLAVDKSVFADGLVALGIQAGDVVYVRSSYDDMATIDASPLELIEILCDAVGKDGTLIMPTYPTNGATYPYLVDNPHFHWRRTPSMSGLLTELFRRMKDTRRSLHPTHSIAVRGKLARELTEGHEDAKEPFDESSPYARFLSHDVKLLSIGRFDSLPMRHLADHLVRDHIPLPIYCDDPVSVTLTGPDKRELTREMRTHNPGIHGNHEVVLVEMDRAGLVRRTRVGRVPMMVVSLRSFVDAYERCVRSGLLTFRLKGAALAQ